MTNQLLQRLGRVEEGLFDQKRSHMRYLSDGRVGECK